MCSWAYDDEKTEFHARNIAAKVGCTQANIDDMVACLKLIDYKDLSHADNVYSVRNENLNHIAAIIPLTTVE